MDNFALINLIGAKAVEARKNASLVKHIDLVVDEAVRLTNRSIDHQAPFDQPIATLLYTCASRLKNDSKSHLASVVEAIVNQSIVRDVQLNAALKYISEKSKDKSIDASAFHLASGVGVVVSADRIESLVEAAIKEHEEKLLAMRYRFNVGLLMTPILKQEPWADGGLVKKEIELQILLKLGPKTVDELSGNLPPLTKTKVKAPKEAKAVEKKADKATANGQPEPEVGADTIEELMRTRMNFHAVGDNHKTDGYVTTEHYDRLIKQHIAMNSGRVTTRFPPEPNGLLHIGHAKAININFGYAMAQGGECNLRYDDTNPEKEEARFFVGIRDMVEWLGYKPARVTHTSDNFNQLFKWAVQLIRDGHAYICHQTIDEMRGYNPPPSPYRDRPAAESEQLFYNMRDGRFAEGGATLRMKLKLEDSKQDPVIYRIKYLEHHRTGTKWCIYPTYDYSHCLCDSIEHVTHSMCSKEFQGRRSSYYWLCNTLRVYCPVQWEFGRLGMTYTVMSKRKIAALIDAAVVADYDDPRLFTLTALRRRGVPSAAVNAFVAKLGVTMAQCTVEPHLLDACIRDALNATAKRCMAVMNPLRINITNFEESSMPNSVERPDFPAEPSRGTHSVPFSSTLYIDGDDFRADSDTKGFKRLTSAQPVGLVNANVVLTVTKVHPDAQGGIASIDATVTPLTTTNKPKGFIQWVCDGLPCEVRMYGQLFKHKNPEDATEVPGGFMSDINVDSLSVVKNALVDRSVRDAQTYTPFQFLRIGYFSVDPDSQADKLVFNRTVMLREDSAKI